MNIMKRMGWAVTWCAIVCAGRVAGQAAPEAAETAPGAAAAADGDSQYILDRIIELEKKRIQRQVELEQYRARKAELEKQIEEWEQRKQELERRQAELAEQTRRMDPAAPKAEPGWYAALGPVDLHADDPARPPVRFAAGGYLRVVGRKPDGGWRVRYQGAEYVASPGDHLMEDSALRARLERNLAEARQGGDTNQVERIRVTLGRLRLQLRDAAAEELRTEIVPKPQDPDVP